MLCMRYTNVYKQTIGILTLMFDNINKGKQNETQIQVYNTLPIILIFLFEI